MCFTVNCFLQLVALMTVRKLLDFVFTQSDLYWLDHLLPDEIRRTKEDELKKKEQRTEMICVNFIPQYFVQTLF